MSTLAVGTIKSVSSAAPLFQNTSGTEIDQLAKAYVKINGVSGTFVRQEFGVSSVTDSGTGDYTVPFSNPMSNANYKIHITACDNVTGAASIMNRKATLYVNTAPTTSQYRIAGGYNYYTASAFHDNTNIFTDVHGDLA